MSVLARPLKWPPVFPLEKGLVLWLPFDDRSGARAMDRSGKANHGTLYGPTWVAGRRGSALSFDGVDDYVIVPHHPTLNITGKKVTRTVWIKPTDVTLGFNTIILKPWSHNTVLHLTDIWNYTNTESGIVNEPVSVAGRSGQWIHVATVYDGDGVPGQQLKTYIDGVLKGSWAQTGNLLSYESDTYIGSQSPSVRPFNGVIDEVCLYNRALNAAEVKRLYESEIRLTRW